MVPERTTHPEGPAASPPALAAAVRAAARFDRGMVSWAAGLLAGVPVVALLGGGIAAGNRVAAVTMAAGAMLVGIAWRTRGGRPPLALMAVDAVLMATSTFVGCVTGVHPWVHLALLCLWSLLGGLLVALGGRGAVLGTQAIIAVVVFGRFSEPVSSALGIAGFVLVGGLTQVAFLTLVRWPPPLRGQRAATAAAYSALGELARDSRDASSLPAALALDEAEAALAAGSLFGDPALMTLRTLVSEGHRTRVQLSALQSLMVREEIAPERRDAAAGVLEDAAAVLQEAAAAIQGAPGAEQRLAQLDERLDKRLAQLEEPRPSGGDEASGAPQLARRLGALAGQLRAVASLAPATATSAGLRSRRPQRRTSRPLETVRADFAQIRANASLHSPAGRHAVRLAVVVPAAELIARQLPLNRGYWMVVAAATVLRPEFGATFTRGAERAVGTALGVALAGAIAVGLHPAGGITVLIVAALGWIGYATFPASFAVGFAFITALVVFLLNALSPDTLSTATARMLDTLIGGTLGLAVYALWPTWSQRPALQSLAALVDAQRRYLGAVLAALASGRRVPEDEIRSLARGARLARTTAEATIANSLADPAAHRIDPAWSQNALAAMRRLVQTAHVLRLDVAEERERRPLPGVAPLNERLEQLLVLVQRRLELDPGSPEAHVNGRDGRSPSPSVPDLREAYASLARSARGDPEAVRVLGELDEIVDAAGGLGALVGLDPADRADPADLADPAARPSAEAS